MSKAMIMLISRLKYALSPAACLALFAGATGCINETAPDEQLGRVQNAATLDREFTIGTGTSKIRVFVRRCDYASSISGAAETTCTLPTVNGLNSEWVLVGGGAEVTGDAVLTAAYPVNTTPGENRDYIAKSQSPTSASHQLRAYVIGLKLGNQDSTAAAFALDNFGNMNRQDRPLFGTCDTPNPPQAPGSNFTIIGGGAQAFGGGWLVENRPFGSQWRARISNSALQVKAFSIMIKRCPTGVPGWVSGGCLTFNVPTNSPGPFNGEATSQFSVPSDWVVTAIGGTASFSPSPARHLTDLIPFSNTGQTQRGFTVRSVNPSNPNDGAFLTGYAVAIKKQ